MPAQEAEGQIQFLAHHDALTGFPTGRSFNNRIDQEIEAAPRPAAGSSPCSASTSTGSRRSMTCSVTRPATRCCQTWRARVTADPRRDADDGAARRRRVRHPDARADPRGRGRASAGAHPGSAAQPRTRTPTGPVIATSIGIALYPDDATDRADAAEPRRHGPLPRQNRGPRHLSLLRGQDGRAGARPPAARARPAPRHRAGRVAACLSAADG